MSWIVTEVRQSLRTNVAPDDDVHRTAITLHGDDEESFLPENLGVTGREPNTNPPNWPADHRRVPAHRFPILNPNWTAIAGPLPMRILLWDMFVGCQLLQVRRLATISTTALLTAVCSGATLFCE